MAKMLSQILAQIYFTTILLLLYLLLINLSLANCFPLNILKRDNSEDLNKVQFWKSKILDLENRLINVESWIKQHNFSRSDNETKEAILTEVNITLEDTQGDLERCNGYYIGFSSIKQNDVRDMCASRGEKMLDHTKALEIINNNCFKNKSVSIWIDDKMEILPGTDRTDEEERVVKPLHLVNSWCRSALDRKNTSQQCIVLQKTKADSNEACFTNVNCDSKQRWMCQDHQ